MFATTLSFFFLAELRKLTIQSPLLDMQPVGLQYPSRAMEQRTQSHFEGNTSHFSHPRATALSLPDIAVSNDRMTAGKPESRCQIETS